MNSCCCGNPRACTCFQPTPPRNYYPNQYPTPGPVTPNQNSWQPSYSAQPAYMFPPSMQTYTDPRQMTFHNQFAASYNNNPITPAPIRTALGDATNTNTAATRPTRKKRKRTEKNSEANTRRRLNNELGVDAPAVFGVGPLSAGAAASAAALDATHHLLSPTSPVSISGHSSTNPTGVLPLRQMFGTLFVVSTRT
jgi:hypothetical protein